MKKVSAIGIKEKDKPFRIINAKQYREELDALPPGRYQNITEKQKRKASPEQFRYLYGLVYPLSMIALNNAGYEFTDNDQVDLFWKELFANKVIMNRETGELMKIPLTKSEFMTIDEMTYCNAIRDYCAEYYHTYIPDPDPNWKLHKTKS